MDNNRRYFYLAEGECEEKLLRALKLKPSLIHPGKVEKFNIIRNELPIRRLMPYPSGCVVVLVFDTDKEVTEHPEANLKLYRYEGEIVRKGNEYAVIGIARRAVAHIGKET